MDLSVEDGKLVALLTLWTVGFSKQFHRRYHFSAKDVATASDFIKSDPGLALNEIMKTAWDAWLNAENPRPSNPKKHDYHFYSRRAVLLDFFLKHYEQIIQEANA